MENKRMIYENLLNEHRFVTNQIGEIKAKNFEPTEEDKKEIQKLEKRLVELMNRMKTLFNGNFGK